MPCAINSTWQKFWLIYKFWIFCYYVRNNYKNIIELRDGGYKWKKKRKTKKEKR